MSSGVWFCVRSFINLTFQAIKLLTCLNHVQKHCGFGPYDPALYVACIECDHPRDGVDIPSNTGTDASDNTFQQDVRQKNQPDHFKPYSHIAGPIYHTVAEKVAIEDHFSCTIAFPSL